MTTCHFTPSRRVLLLALVGLALLALGAGPAAAASKSSKAQPCWQRVVHDWYVDGRIDGTYPPKCLAEATQHIPQDAREYSSFVDEAHRALLADERWQRQHPGKKPHYDFGGKHKGGDDWGPSSLYKGGGGGGKSASGGPVPYVLDSIGPSDPSSVPVPLLVLAGLAVVLMLAGVASFVARRFQRPGGTA